MAANTYRVQRVRMINFHNFVDETIEIKNGGHLFLLGDNGSGKTTVLDALHYVLTAGQSMEFNSAARVAGNRKDSGRRVQGIVMRYNTGSGELNPTGGVSYAAVELVNSQGRLLSLAVGLSCRSMDERIERWGVILPEALEEIPFLMDELEGQRPRNRREMKEAQKKGYYGQINSYTKELANRLYGDEATYQEVCKFLSTGKAYREIVSRTADYHQLFRQLLQEPDPEVFDRVIEHLRSLEDSRQNLEQMRDKLGFLSGLNTLRDEIDALMYRRASLNCRKAQKALQQLQEQQARTAEKCAGSKEELLQLDETIDRTEVKLDDLRQRINALQNKDKDGLLQREQELSRDLKEAARQLEQQKKRHKELSREQREKQKELDRQRAGLVKALRDRFTTLYKAVAALPFSAERVLNALDRAADAADPENQITALYEHELREQTDTELIDAQSAQRSLLQHIKQQDELLAELQKKWTEKSQQGESEPRIDGFAEAKQQFHEKMHDAQPLYLGLVPRLGLKQRELGILEQLIGEEILGCWVTSPEEEVAVRHLLLSGFPEQTLAVVEKDADDQIAGWIRKYFDIEQSDPTAIIALHREMCAASGPVSENLREFEVIKFRARQQRFRDQPVRLLGAEARKRQLEREMKQLEAEIKTAKNEGKQLSREQKKRQAHMDALKELKAALDFHELRRCAPDIHEAVRCVATLEERKNATYDQMIAAEETHVALAGKLSDVHLKIDSEGLKDLDDRIDAMEKQLRTMSRKQNGNLRRQGQIQQDISAFEQRFQKLKEDIEEEAGRVSEAEAALRALTAPDNELLPADDNLSTMAQMAERLDLLLRESIQKQERLREMAKGRDGMTFAFTYDADSNALQDRRGLSAAEVFADLSKNYEEQKAIFTEDTRTLFEQLIMHDLLSALRDRVSRLTDMARKINRMLKTREFGNNRYAFHARPLDRYKRLYNLIHNYSELAAEDPAAELKTFIEDHQDEIINTESGDMPELLDYRNWFHFELQVKTSVTDSEGVVMDRKTKSIGSGGEQAVPNYLLILTIAHFLYDVPAVKLPLLLFDEAFYGIDTQRRDQLLAFASDLNLQLLVASPDQDGVKKEIAYSTSLFVIKDAEYNIHLHDFHWQNPKSGIQQDLLNPEATAPQAVRFGDER